MTETTELVCYVFVHDHLSTVQKGIQAAHVVASLMSLDEEDAGRDLVTEWAREHKTMLLCRGGNSERLNFIDSTFLSTVGEFPFMRFQEDFETLGGLLTAVAIILPKVQSVDSVEWLSWSRAKRETQGICWEAKLISV